MWPFGPKKSAQTQSKELFAAVVEFTMMTIERSTGISVDRLPNEVRDQIMKAALVKPGASGAIGNKYDFCAIYMFVLAFALHHMNRRQDGHQVLMAFAEFIENNRNNMSSQICSLARKDLEACAPK